MDRQVRILIFIPRSRGPVTAIVKQGLQVHIQGRSRLVFGYINDSDAHLATSM